MNKTLSLPISFPSLSLSVSKITVRTAVGQGAIKFWRQRIGPALEQKYKDKEMEIDKDKDKDNEARNDDCPSMQNMKEERYDDLFSAYCGLLHV